jgi:hypothetical protein
VQARLGRESMRKKRMERGEEDENRIYRGQLLGPLKKLWVE